MIYFIIEYDREHLELVAEDELADKLAEWGRSALVRIATKEEIEEAGI